MEYYGFVRAMRAIDRADVALLVMRLHARRSPTRTSAWRAIAAERGCAMVIVLNKWDLVEGPDAKAEVRENASPIA